MRDHGIVDFEQQAQAIALVCELPLRGLRALVVQHVVDGHGDLLATCCMKLDVRLPIRVRAALPKPIAPSRRSAVVRGTTQ